MIIILTSINIRIAPDNGHKGGLAVRDPCAKFDRRGRVGHVNCPQTRRAIRQVGDTTGQSNALRCSGAVIAADGPRRGRIRQVPNVQPCLTGRKEYVVARYGNIIYVPWRGVAADHGRRGRLRDVEHTQSWL